MRLRPLLLLVCAVFVVGGCDRVGGAAVVGGGVPVVPDAVVDVAFADVAAFVDVVARGVDAGVVPDDALRLSRSALEAAGVVGPVDVAVRPSGDVVVAAAVTDVARLQTALSLALPQGGRLERRVGVVDAVVVGASDVAVVGVNGGVVVVVVSPADALGAAALVDALVSGRVETTKRTLPPGSSTTLSAGPALAAALPDVTGLSGAVRVDGNDVVIDLHVGVRGELRTLASGLAAAPPMWSCAVEEGAALSLRLPPASAQALTDLVGGDGALGDGAGSDLDAFAGRVVLAVHEVSSSTPLARDDKATWGSLVVAGVPRAGAAAGLKKTLDDAGRAVVARTVGARTVLDLQSAARPWRRLSAVVDDDVFALGVGAPVVVDRVAVSSSLPGGCPVTPGRLLTVDGPRLLGVVSRAAPELALLRAANVDVALLPAAVRVLTATERLEIDAVPRNDSVDVAVRFRPVKK